MKKITVYIFLFAFLLLFIGGVVAGAANWIKDGNAGSLLTMASSGTMLYASIDFYDDVRHLLE